MTDAPELLPLMPECRAPIETAPKDRPILATRCGESPWGVPMILVWLDGPALYYGPGWYQFDKPPSVHGHMTGGMPKRPTHWWSPTDDATERARLTQEVARLREALKAVITHAETTITNWPANYPYDPDDLAEAVTAAKEALRHDR